MTREQIEQAWKEHTLCNPSMMDELSLNERQAFVKGAQWRINSVWHKPSQNGEELVAGRMVIAKFKEGYVFGKFDEGEIYKRTLIFLSRSFIEYPLSEVLEYAYLEDLLPERKEETE